MDVKYINAVCKAVENIFDSYFGVKASVKKPYAGQFSIKASQISVIVGVNQDLDGQIICSFDYEVAKKIVGLMMGGMDIQDLDDMGWSAIQEFGNWVAGTSATELSAVGVRVDVTTPIINEGNSKFRSSEIFVTVPLESEIGLIEVHVSLGKKSK